MNNKGFTLIEMLLVMFILTSLTVVTITNTKELDLDYLYLMNDYIEAQAASITSNETNDIDEYNISFNENGHVNRAQTINISDHNVIIHLGNGYLTYE